MRHSKKITLKFLQQLTGLLNFIGQAVVPGRAFTCRLYTKMNLKLRPYHHIRVDKEMRKDLEVWGQFLKLEKSIVRPFIDLNHTLIAEQIRFFTDSSKTIGAGGYWQGHYFHELWIWDLDFSIAFLELYSLTAGLLLWGHHFKNSRIIVRCDNLRVVHMLNNSSSKCKLCMTLIRIIVLPGLQLNLRVFGSWISTEDNNLADALSRNNLD